MLHGVSTGKSRTFSGFPVGNVIVNKKLLNTHVDTMSYCPIKRCGNQLHKLLEPKYY